MSQDAEGVAVHKVLFWILSDLLRNHSLQFYEHILQITDKAAVDGCVNNWQIGSWQSCYVCYDKVPREELSSRVCDYFQLRTFQNNTSLRWMRGRRDRDGARKSPWRSAHEIVFVRILYIEEKSKNMINYYRYIIIVNFVSTVQCFRICVTSGHKALILNFDLCKNSFGGTYLPFHEGMGKSKSLQKLT